MKRMNKNKQIIEKHLKDHPEIKKFFPKDKIIDIHSPESLGISGDTPLTVINGRVVTTRYLIEATKNKNEKS